MKKESCILFFISLMYLMSSCELGTTLEIEIPDGKKRLVANCIFHADSLMNATIWHSQHVLDPQSDTGNFVSNAVVKLRSAENEIPFYFNPRYRVYRSGSKSEAGKQYTLEVSAPGYETITATTKVPEPIEIMDVQSSTIPHPEYPGQLKRTINIRFKDPAGELNYYAVAVLAVFKSPDKSPEKPDVIFGTFDANISPTDPAFSDAYYREYVIESERSPVHLNYLFNDRLFNGGEFTFSVSCTDVNYMGGPDNLYYVAEYHIFLKSLSEEYYDYRVTYNLQQETKRDPFGQPVQVFNNVENGFGIFAGYSQSVNVHTIR